MLLLEPPGKVSCAGQGQLLLVPGLVLLVRNYKVICGWLPLLLGLQVFGRCYLMNQGQSPLVPGLCLLISNCVLDQDWPPLMTGLGPHDRSYNTS